MKSIRGEYKVREKLNIENSPAFAKKMPGTHFTAPDNLKQYAFLFYPIGYKQVHPMCAVVIPVG